MQRYFSSGFVLFIVLSLGAQPLDMELMKGMKARILKEVCMKPVTGSSWKQILHVNEWNNYRALVSAEEISLIQ